MAHLRNWHLFGICIVVWGTTWYTITFQLGHTAPEVGVAYRFALAGVAILATVRLRALPLRLSLGGHAFAALQGCFMYGLAYLAIYHAERYLPSGIVAVGYSASPLMGGIGARLLWGASLTPRFVAGGLLGLCGVSLLFWREIALATASRDTVLGGVLTLAAVLLSAVGNLAASRNRHRGLPFWPVLGWGMLYGALTCALAAWLKGADFRLPLEPSWWLSLLYLSLLGSVLTFACFLKLQERVGPGRAGAVGVMTPLLALSLSVVLEDYDADTTTVLGATLALLGNVLMLARTSVTAPTGAATPVAASVESSR